MKRLLLNIFFICLLGVYVFVFFRWIWPVEGMLLIKAILSAFVFIVTPFLLLILILHIKNVKLHKKCKE